MREIMKDNQLIELSESIIQFYEKIHSWELGVARNNGLSVQQNHTIEIVGSSGPIRMKPLAEKLSVTMGTLTVMVDRLEKSGYLIRQKDPDDARGFNIVLTSKGHGIHDEHHAYHLKLAEDITSHLDDEQTNGFLNTIKTLNEVL
jgi:DNA-binding MarR family transcriptional regulator